MKPSTLVRPGVSLLLALLLGVSSSSAQADADGDHDLALDLYKRGEIHALRDILRTARERVPGELVDINLVQKAGSWVYRIRIVTPEGRRVTLDIDAREQVILDEDIGE